uniref:Nucleophosmin n=1 Tax=Mola mola TaxID=94237 RepID=A0A3Q4AKI4_MOLML
EFKVDVDDDDTEQQLSLKAVCLGAEAEDKFHMVEVEGLTFDGKSTKVPLVVLKPSVMPSMSLGGFEITPPVTFRLQSGSGPVHISGQHFVSEYFLSPLYNYRRKKLKMDSDEDEDDTDDDDDEEYAFFAMHIHYLKFLKIHLSFSFVRFVSFPPFCSDEEDDSDDDVKLQKNVGKEFRKVIF